MGINLPSLALDSKFNLTKCESRSHTAAWRKSWHDGKRPLKDLILSLKMKLSTSGCKLGLARLSRRTRTCPSACVALIFFCFSTESYHVRLGKCIVMEFLFYYMKYPPKCT